MKASYDGNQTLCAGFGMKVNHKYAIIMMLECIMKANMGIRLLASGMHASLHILVLAIFITFPLSTYISSMALG